MSLSDDFSSLLPSPFLHEEAVESDTMYSSKCTMARWEHNQTVNWKRQSSKSSIDSTLSCSRPTPKSLDSPAPEIMVASAPSGFSLARIKRATVDT